MTAVRTIGAYQSVSVVDDSAPIADPGQFHMLALENGWGGESDDRPWLARAISFLSNRPDGTFEFLIDPIGPGTRLLSKVLPGQRIWVGGPFGNGFKSPEPEVQPVLIGGGIGAAPILAMAERFTRDGVAHTSAFGFRSALHAEAAAGLPSAVIATDDGSAGLHGNVIDALNQLELEGSSLFACGPPAMLQAVSQFARERSLPCQVALESPMACGFGACFGCAVETAQGIIRLCVDGPVLDASLFEGIDLRTAAGD